MGNHVDSIVRFRGFDISSMGWGVWGIKSLNLVESPNQLDFSFQ